MASDTNCNFRIGSPGLYALIQSYTTEFPKMVGALDTYNKEKGRCQYRVAYLPKTVDAPKAELLDSLEAKLFKTYLELEPGKDSAAALGAQIVQEINLHTRPVFPNEYKQAMSTFGIDPKLLEEIQQVEEGIVCKLRELSIRVDTLTNTMIDRSYGLEKGIGSVCYNIKVQKEGSSITDYAWTNGSYFEMGRQNYQKSASSLSSSSGPNTSNGMETEHTEISAQGNKIRIEDELKKLKNISVALTELVEQDPLEPKPLKTSLLIEEAANKGKPSPRPTSHPLEPTVPLTAAKRLTESVVPSQTSERKSSIGGYRKP